LAPDLVRYVEAKDGIRVEGLAASANSFGCKIGSGLGTAIVLWLIPLCDYDASLTSQPQTAIYTFIALYWWVPAVLSVVLLVLASLWNINSKTDALLAEKAKNAPAVVGDPSPSESASR
jgi:GPH family glycoside/pentoside/hexuronide:cation symporter